MYFAVVAAPPRLQAQRAPDPLHVHADHARALALPAEGGHREAGQVTHRAVVALGDRAPDRLAQLVQVDAIARALEALLLDPAVECLRLRGAEEVPVEEELEDPAVLL